MLGKGAPRCHSDGVTLPADEPRSPLDIPDYRRFWLARFLSVFATTGMVVVLGYQLYDVARSQYGMSIGTAAFQLGLLGLAQFLPVLLLTPVAGLIADRYDRRIVAGSAVGIDMVVALVLMLATIAGHLNLPLLFALGALHGTARVFIGPAMASIAPSTAHQATLDLHEGTPHSLMMEPPGLALHLWRPGMGLVTHVSYIGTYKGPEPFRTLQ